MKYDSLLQKLKEQMDNIEDTKPSSMILEYFKGDPMINPKFNQTKDPNRVHMRKHKNTKPLEYRHMDPDVERVSKGLVDRVPLLGPRLQNLLQKYNITFKPGTKGLGRSHAVLVMYNTARGPAAIIQRK